MATPKYKTSKAKAASRKAANMKLSAPNLSECQTCGNLIPSHVETLFLHTASALSAVTMLESREL